MPDTQPKRTFTIQEGGISTKFIDLTVRGLEPGQWPIAGPVHEGFVLDLTVRGVRYNVVVDGAGRLVDARHVPHERDGTPARPERSPDS